MNNELYFEPPYTKSMSNEEVKAFADQPLEIYIYIYVYIYREREREREKEQKNE